MKLLNKLKSLLFFLLIIIIGNACTKNFDKINTDPNNPSSVPATNLLAFAIQDFGANLWDSWGDIDEMESYSGQITKIQYIDESRYHFRPGTVENMWAYCYRELKSLQIAINDAEAQGNPNLQAAAMTMQAYIWLIATDRWRDIPYSGALAADSGKINPVYDKQEDIYPSLLNELESANALFAQQSIKPIGAGDFIYNGDPGQWQKFCNSLRIRIAMRISKVAPGVAKALVEKIVNDPANNPIITSNADNAFLNWPGSGTTSVLTSEPWYTSLMLSVRLNNYAMAQPFIDTLLKYNDPRIAIFAQPTAADAPAVVYRGAVVGSPLATLPGPQYSFIGSAVGGNPTGYSPFLRAAEVKFNLAEAAALGWNVGGIADSLYYKDGISLSFGEWGAAEGGYASSPNVAWNGDIRKIYIQKWIALFKNGHEAWAEMRRTDVPLLPPASGSLYTGHTRPPFRYPYPNSETTLNGANSKASVENVVDDFWGQQMWWDTRTGVK